MGKTMFRKKDRFNAYAAADSAGRSVRLAAFFAALFLSLLGSTLYNVWNYDVVRCQTENGNYHARLIGDIDGNTLEVLRGYAGVESAVVNEAESGGEQTAVDLLFSDVSSVYEEMPQIARLAGLNEEDITYHQELLNYYFVVNPNDPASQDAYALLMVFAAAGILSCFSLILIIHHAYAVFMNDKVRQLGILASVGATPGQIRGGLIREAFSLSAVPVAAGMFLGTALSAGLMAWINAAADSAVENRLHVPFACSALILGLTLLGTLFTVLISAWMPARRLSRLTPLAAIRGADEKALKKKKNPRLLRFLFGIEGELAGNALKVQKKALRTASLSLTASFLAFGFIQCLFAIMTLNTDLTYFDAYRDAWDVMAVVKDTNIGEFADTETVQALPDARDVLVYQKGTAKRLLTEEELSAEFQEAGGFADAPELYVRKEEGGFLVNAPLYILDDASFLAYCRHVGVSPSLSGAVVLNQVRDGSDPNFRVRHTFPYLKEEQVTTVLESTEGGETLEIPVLGYAQELPVMREEYQTLDYYELIHVLPVSLWAKISGPSWAMEADTCIRILAGDGKGDAYTEVPESEKPDLARLDGLEAELHEALAGRYELETENRIEDKAASDKANAALRSILGGFCVLLAVMGVGNVFTNTLGFARQRRRETARYLSVGMTPGGIWKMFFVEAFVLAGRPVLISLPLLAACTGLFLKSAYLEAALLLPRLPTVCGSLLAFALAVFAAVALAYYLGGRRLMKLELAEVLKDETVV